MKTSIIQYIYTLSLFFGIIGIAQAQTITDYSFEDGTEFFKDGVTPTGWELYVHGSNDNVVQYSYSETEKVERDKSLKIQVSTRGTISREYIHQPINNLEANKSYKLTCWLKVDDLDNDSDGDGNQVQLRVEGDIIDTGKAFRGVDMTKEWQAYSFIFQTSGTLSSASLKVRYSSISTFYIDRFTLSEVGIFDGSFEQTDLSDANSNDKNWLLKKSDGYFGSISFPYMEDEATDGNRVAKLYTETAHTGNKFKLQTERLGALNLEDNTSYRLTFLAKKDNSHTGEEIELKTGVVVGTKDGDPNAVSIQYESSILTTEWEEYSVVTPITDYSVIADESDKLMNFACKTALSTIYIDNVKFNSLSSDATLSSITVGGEPIADFTAETMAYNVVLSRDEVPEITAVANEKWATVEVKDASDTSQPTEIIVTADDGTEKKYIINFTLNLVFDGGFENTNPTDVEDERNNWYLVQPNNGEGTLTFLEVGGGAIEGSKIARFETLKGHTGKRVRLETDRVSVLDLQDNTDYRLTFFAKKDASNGEAIELRAVTVIGTDAGDPNTVSEQTVLSTLDTEWKEFSEVISTTDYSVIGSDDNKLMYFSCKTENSIIYIDNISFNSLSSDATLSSISVGGEAIADFSAETMTYNVTLSRDEVPEITAVATEKWATVVVNDASDTSQPTTIVVTADDGTEKTYTINFTLALAFDGSFENTAPSDIEDERNNWYLVRPNDDEGTLTFPEVGEDAVEGSKIARFETNRSHSGSRVRLETDRVSVLDLQDNTDYRLTFSAKKDVSNTEAIELRTVTVIGTNAGDPNTVSEQTVLSTLNTEWEEFSEVISITDYSVIGNDDDKRMYFSCKTENSVIYLDNISFNTLSSDATLSDIAVAGETLAYFDSETTAYNVELLEDEIPEITAVATEKWAKVVVNEASDTSQPTTIIVTADDGTEKTYTINFILSEVVFAFDKSFENKKWVLDVDEANGAEASVSYITDDVQDGEKAVKVTVSKASSKSIHANLIEANWASLELADDTEYTISFYAKANVDGAIIRLRAPYGYDNGTLKDKVKNTNIGLTTSWAKYDVTITLENYAEVESKELFFRFLEVGTFYIDNISVRGNSYVWNEGSWDIGEPTLANDASIASNYTGSGFICNNLTVENGQTLEIGNGTLDIKGNFVNNGTVIIKSGASLMTYESGSFSGNNIVIERNTRYSNGQYSFVGSVVKQNTTLKGKALGRAIYKYDETQGYGDNEGLNRWVKASKDILIPGRGYTQAYKQKLTFTGEPNNGTVTYTGTYTTDADKGTSVEGWNLVANPYPTAINIFKFLNEAGNAQNIEGSVYIWDDNGSDKERGTNEDYIVINGVGITSSSRRNSGSRLHKDGGAPIIGAGQGFFVKLRSDRNSEDISFTESMRKAGMNADENFFRKASEVETKQTLRLSLESNDKELFGGTLLGFLEDATEGVDRLYDALQLSASDLQLYSLLNNNHYAIQGLPTLSGERMIALGIDVQEAGTYNIDIAEMENLSENVVVELIDTKLNMIHNLSEGAYTFDTEEVVEDTRFVLNIRNTVISSLDNALQSVSINATINGLKLFGGKAYNVQIMDVTGKMLLKQKLTNTSELPYNFERSKLYIVKVNETVQKVIFQ